MVRSLTELPERSANGIGPAMLHMAIGLAFGMLCAAAGLPVVGMGHGWGLPLRYGFLSLLLYPLAMLRWRSLDGARPWRRDIILTAVWTLLILPLATHLEALPPAPRSNALQWLVLAGLPAAYGLAGWALERHRLHTAFADAALIAVGVLLDLAAWHAFNGDTDGAGLARVYSGTVIPWLVLWLGWQAVAILALMRHLRRRARSATA